MRTTKNKPTTEACVDSAGSPEALAAPSADNPNDPTSGSVSTSFPIVGLGASAGGLEALRQLFAHIPANSGMGFVVIQHLDPDRPSMLTSVLSTVTTLPVVEVTKGMPVEPNRVHVIPSGSDLTIRRAVLTLVPRLMTGRLHLPIDSFFSALAEDQHRRAIGVVLSGSGADGAEGLRAIKAAGGIAIAQAPASAQFRSMPDSALAAGVVDFCAGPEEIANELARLSQHPYVARARITESEGEQDTRVDQKSFARIVALVLDQQGIDFRGYKTTTVRRRIQRRMALRRVGTLSEYADALRSDPAESRALAQDMLIHVTSFFRDPHAFDALERHVFCELAKHKQDGSTVRIWVPGCSTGEEVYALAICLLESLDGLGRNLPIKIFGSDLSAEAIQTARLGRYSESALVDVSSVRLSRFFEPDDGGYRIGKRIRELCVFVKHDLTRDPPFAKLDLISCRNVLIYFDAELQRRVVPMLHYCLAKPGYLFVGQSEAIIGFRDLFAPLDKDHRIFAKTGESTRVPYALASGREVAVKLTMPAIAERRDPAKEAQRQADHLLLARFAPPGVVVNERLEIIQFRGHTGAFLESPPGQPEANVLRMVRHDLVVHLHEAVERAKAQSDTVCRQNLTLSTGAGVRVVDLEVVPLGMAESRERFFLILFKDADTHTRHEAEPSPAAPTDSPSHDSEESPRLKAELSATKDYLQSLIGEHQRTTDELAAINEEMIAANEELRSTNEELQSAKEELQATNEELGTVNDELRSRNADLDEVANDLVNVLASVEIPVIIVDQELRVRRFTPTVHQIVSFIPADIGRPIDDLKLKVKVDDLNAKIREVIHALAPREWEVQGPDGHWFRMQIRPYRTADNRLDGAVLAFLDVDALKNALREAESARDYARSIVETVTNALVVLDAQLRVVSANSAFWEQFALTPDAAEGQNFFGIGAGIWEDRAMQDVLADALAKHLRFTGLELAAEFPRIGRKIMSLTGRPILWGGGAPMILLAIDDVTSLRTLEEERARLLKSETQARQEAQQANRAKDLFLATLSHELRTPLSTMLMQSQILRQLGTEDRRLLRASAVIERAATTQARLIDDLLDVSRIVSGKLLLDSGVVDFREVVQNAIDATRPSAQAKALQLEAFIDNSVASIYGDAIRLHQVVANLLTNAVKFTPHGGRIVVRLDQIDKRAQLTVEDTGIGIRPDVLPHLFTRFVQADSSVTRTHGGLGLGLAIVRHLVEVHGGEVSAESPGEGKGSIFRVLLPIGSAGVPPDGGTSRAIARDISGVRVLLVEDDEEARESFATMLEQLGAVVRATASAAAGLAALKEFQAQVILCDIAMPGEDGYSFIKKVRGLGPERGGQIPAAALTALASDDDKTKARQAGFQVHIPKPVLAGRLAAVVANLVAGAQLTSSGLK